LGTSDLQFSRIGFGAWAIGGAWKYGWGTQSEDQAIEAIRRAVDLGVNWIDTAPIYGLGRSEVIVGKAIRGLRRPVGVATKCGLLDAKGGEIKSCLRKKSILKELEGSLKRLGVNEIDLYQIHWPRPEEEIEEGWDTILRAIAAGKVRFGGVCNFSPKQLSKLIAMGPITSLQPPYSLFNQRIEGEILEFTLLHQIGVISYAPMAHGLLTGKFTREWLENLAADDFRKWHSPHFQEPEFSTNLDFVNEGLAPIARKHNVGCGQIAVAWVLARQAINCAIVGARNVPQVEENVRAARVQLDDSDFAAITRGLVRRKNGLAAKNETRNA
jgi:aryl-alcohol dehydrogenase-like predicted oxidoreductase